MSSAEVVAAAVEDGRLTLREAESLLGHLALVDALPHDRWAHATYWRRRGRLQLLGLAGAELGTAPRAPAPLACAR